MCVLLDHREAASSMRGWVPASSGYLISQPTLTTFGSPMMPMHVKRKSFHGKWGDSKILQSTPPLEQLLLLANHNELVEQRIHPQRSDHVGQDSLTTAQFSWSNLHNIAPQKSPGIHLGISTCGFNCPCAEIGILSVVLHTIHIPMLNHQCHWLGDRPLYWGLFLLCFLLDS